MPEAVAVVKLRGFLEDLGAKLLESQPGLIRVQFGEPAVPEEKPRGLLGWLRRFDTALANAVLAGSRRNAADPCRISVDRRGLAEEIALDLIAALDREIDRTPRGHDYDRQRGIALMH